MQATHKKVACRSDAFLDLVCVKLIFDVTSDTVPHDGSHQQWQDPKQHYATQDGSKDDYTGGRRRRRRRRRRRASWLRCKGHHSLLGEAVCQSDHHHSVYGGSSKPHEPHQGEAEREQSHEGRAVAARLDTLLSCRHRSDQYSNYAARDHCNLPISLQQE